MMFNSFVRRYCSKTTGKLKRVKHPTDAGVKESASTFDQVINQKRSQAGRSIVIQVSSVNSAGDVFGILSKFGNVSSMHHYTAGTDDFLLVEMEDKGTVNEVMKLSTFAADLPVIPVRSRFLWLKSNGSLTTHGLPNCLRPSDKQLPGGSDSAMYATWSSLKNISEQMQALHTISKLGDVESRLRFLVCEQVESALKGIFAMGRVLPFGSSVNGCGKTGSDLDMVYQYYNSPTESFSNPDARLIQQAKGAISNGRASSQRHMEIIADILQGFVPGPDKIRRILHARVPILKFFHTYTDLDCDLSTYNMSGLYMSELLYLYGELDDRFRPLIFAVRWWAQEVKLTSHNPGPYITNFSLSMLVIYFLQTRKSPVLPTLGALMKQARPEDTRITAGISCTFLRNVKAIKKSQNNSTLSDLLLNFFQFVSMFPFEDAGLSIVTGTETEKPGRQCWLYIENPLERELNVTKNVSAIELRRLVTCAADARDTLWKLRNPSVNDWGLLALRSNSNHRRDINVAGIDLEDEENTITETNDVNLIKDCIVSPLVSTSPELKSALIMMKSKNRVITKSEKSVKRSKSVTWKY